jgi:hypothetical protein
VHLVQSALLHRLSNLRYSPPTSVRRTTKDFCSLRLDTHTRHSSIVCCCCKSNTLDTFSAVAPIDASTTTIWLEHLKKKRVSESVVLSNPTYYIQTVRQLLKKALSFLFICFPFALTSLCCVLVAQDVIIVESI